MHLRQSTNALGETTSKHARCFASDSNPGWTMGSITDETDEATFERFRVLMFAHEAELEGYLKQFGTDTHRAAFNAWDALYQRLGDEAGIGD